MIMDGSWYMDWYFNKASEQEKKLVDRIGDLGELFEDMLFDPDTNPYSLIRCQSMVKERNEWIVDEAQRPNELEYFSYTFFHYKVEPLDYCGGFFDRSRQLLCVPPGALEDDVTILHEMIHLHESVINDLPMFYHDMLYWALYQDLRTKIDGLDGAINDHAHILTGQQLYRNGGLHDILFLLKSFDLDIRKGYPMGTVFGYGRVDEFKYLEIIPQSSGS